MKVALYCGQNPADAMRAAASLSAELFLALGLPRNFLSVPEQKRVRELLASALAGGEDAWLAQLEEPSTGESARELQNFLHRIVIRRHEVSDLAKGQTFPCLLVTSREVVDRKVGDCRFLGLCGRMDPEVWEKRCRNGAVDVLFTDHVVTDVIDPELNPQPELPGFAPEFLRKARVVCTPAVARSEERVFRLRAETLVVLAGGIHRLEGIQEILALVELDGQRVRAQEVFSLEDPPRRLFSQPQA